MLDSGLVLTGSGVGIVSIGGGGADTIRFSTGLSTGEAARKLALGSGTGIGATGSSTFGSTLGGSTLRGARGSDATCGAARSGPPPM